MSWLRKRYSQEEYDVVVEANRTVQKERDYYRKRQEGYDVLSAFMRQQDIVGVERVDSGDGYMNFLVEYSDGKIKQVGLKSQGRWPSED